MEYRIVENKTASIIGNIGLFIFLSAFLVMGVGVLIGIFFTREYVIYSIGYFLLCLPVILVFLLIAKYFSTIDRDTKKFLYEVRSDLKTVKSISDLEKVKVKLWNEAVDKNNMIRTSFPLSVKELIREIDYKIEILSSIKNG